MKHIITFILLSLLVVSCTGRNQWRCGDRGRGRLNSTSYDKRCLKIRKEARKKGKEIGVCYNGPLTVGLDKEAKHPNPKACKALTLEAWDKCEALSPPGPDDIVHTSGSATYRGGKFVMKDGKPVCP